MGRRRNKLDLISVISLDGVYREKDKRITREEAWWLVESGHARWNRQYVIQLLRNIPMGPALSLRVGDEIALQAGLGMPWARLAIQNICERRRIT